MATLGSILSTTDVPNKAQRTGVVTLLITDATKAVAFGTAMPSANYRVFLNVEASLSAALWPTAKTVNGFTLNVSVGIAGTVCYLVVED